MMPRRSIFPKTAWLVQHVLLYNASAREIPPRSNGLSNLSIGINLDYLEVFDQIVPYSRHLSVAFSCGSDIRFCRLGFGFVGIDPRCVPAFCAWGFG
jgi:hypothetical protein